MSDEEITVSLPRDVAERLIRAASVFIVELKCEPRSRDLLREGQRRIAGELARTALCEARFGEPDDDRGAYVCQRPTGHLRFAEDGIGHSA